MSKAGRPLSGPVEVRVCAKEGCQNSFEVHTANARTGGQIYCSRACSRQVANIRRAEQKRLEWENSDDALCPCGENRIRYEVRHTTKYCSPECRKTYSPKRTRDPDKHVNLVCENPQCGKVFERYRGLYTPGQRTYCSNACAARANHVIHHIVDAETSTVLDSGWEAFFWGLCRLHKIPIERTDRSMAVEWTPGHYYAPDFFLTEWGVWVEVKGFEDSDDQRKWEAWRTTHGPLAVLDRDGLLRLSVGYESIKKSFQDLTLSV